MECTDQVLAGIVEKSAYLHERITSRFVPRGVRPNEEGVVRQRMARWLHNASLGSAEQFEKRLAWDGLTPQQAEALATGVRLGDADAPLPEWTDTLRRSLLLCDNFAGRQPREFAATRRFIQAEEPYAFEHLMIPFVTHAQDRIRERFPHIDERLSEGAQASLERYLLQWLCAVSAETIDLEFTVFKAVRQRGGVLGATWHLPGVAATTKMYDAFVVYMWGGGLLTFFEEYAALARLTARITDLWVEFVADFLSHLSADRAALDDAFAAGGLVLEAAPGLSDRHNGGVTSIRLRFESGARCIYKPKNLDSEKAYYELLEWCNANGAPLPFRIFSGLYRPTHGWVEIVDNLPCESESEVRRYYQRAGILLCLIYALEGSDCHHENIIASGEYPVLIDMETILQARVAMIEGAEEDASAIANRVFYWDSVFRTALLPRWEFGPNGESYDISGLGGVEGQRTSFKKKAWQHINTDAMTLKKETLHTRPYSNLVHWNGAQQMPANYSGEIVDGFRLMYAFLMKSQDALFAPAGPLARMRDLPLRFIYRHTRIYTAVLNTYLLPQYLRDWMDTSIQVDVLCRPLLHSKLRHPFWPLLMAEESALLQADIPLFGASADSTALRVGATQSIPGFFAEPSFDLLKLRFTKLSAQDLEQQISYIRSCFDTGAAVVTEPVAAPPEEVALSDDELLAEAMAIAGQIRHAAISSSDGSATWVTLAYYADAQRWQTQPMAPRLYDGVTGTAMFLAAIEDVTGGAGFRSLALSGLKTATSYLDGAASSRLLFEAGIGAGLGASSLIYALTRSAEMLGEESLLADAVRSAGLITAERIAEDRRFDLLGGCAGALVALLTLYRARPEPWLLDRAVECGRHLLEHRVASSPGPRAWATLNGELLAGFSHGATGIAFALKRLYRVTGCDEFRCAADEACDYEAALYSEEKGNWPDLRFPATRLGYAFQNSWCHGAPGIGMGRAAVVNEPRNDDAVSVIERAMATTTRERFGPLDHLCCGNLGRAEALLTAGRTLGRDDWQSEARRLTSAVVRRARQNGRYGLGWSAGPYIPSFHQGMAGIGYQFLRMARPDRVPSVLLWE
jgi:type 2 lantibiotic biosynthesis protein LanM